MYCFVMTPFQQKGPKRDYEEGKIYLEYQTEEEAYASMKEIIQKGKHTILNNPPDTNGDYEEWFVSSFPPSNKTHITYTK